MACFLNPRMTPSTPSHDRLKLEPAGPEFPYHQGNPPTLSARGWLLVMTGVVTGYIALTMPLPFTDTVLSGWLRVAAFVVLPLAGLAFAAPGHWKRLFRRVGGREVKLMFAFAFANIVVSMLIGTVIKTFGTTVSNAGIADAAQLEDARLVNFFAKVAPQLLGEELLTLLPFLGILAFCKDRVGLSRNASVLMAWLVSAVAFGLVHLPTYDWNLMQCLVVIGSVRLMLTWAYVWTKNIWVSTGAHILNDWALMAFTVILTPLVPPT
jgi:membrane protease YdiL (CAAX protease family)